MDTIQCRDPVIAMSKLVVPNLPYGIHIKSLGHDQTGELLELQEKVAASVPEELFECDDAAFYSGLFNGQGRVLGLFDGKTLLACSVISWPGSHSPNNLGTDIDLNAKQRALVVNLEAAYVLSFYQGRGIARLLSGMQLDFARQMGKRHALSTASPANLYSLKNLFSLGFSIRKIAEKYGGKIRCIMYRDLSEPQAKKYCNSSLQGLWISSSDLTIQKNLLAQGYEGIDAKGIKKNFSICYLIKS